MDNLIDAAQDNFTTFLKEAFQWSDVETTQNAPVMFPSLAGAQMQGNSTAAVSFDVHNNSMVQMGTAGTFMQLQAPTAAASLQHRSPFACSGIAPQALHQQQQQACHALTAACGEPQLLLGMTHIPSAEESAALSAQILLLQAQHQQHLQAQQWQQHLHMLPIGQHLQQQHVKHTTIRPHRSSAGEVRPAIGSAGSANKQRQPQLQQQGPPKRGRPPKVSGTYSKGYGAILRFRQRRKAMMEELEQQVADKQQQYEQLQAENNALSSKFKALQGALHSQNDLIDQLAALNLSVGPVDVPTMIATTGDNAAAISTTGKAANVQQGSSWAERAEYKKQMQALKQQELHKRHVQDVPPLYARYKAYVQACAAKLAERPAAAGTATHASQQKLKQKQQSQLEPQAAVQCAVAAAPFKGNGTVAGIPRFTEDHTGFPPMPFDLVETLALFKVSRAAGIEASDVVKSEDSTAATAATGPGVAGSSSSSGVTDTRTINLLTGKHDPVSVQFWSEAAKQIDLQPQQKRQLEASWELYERAILRLNRERQKLQQQIQAAIDGPALAEKLQQQIQAAIDGAALAEKPAHELNGSAAAAACAATAGSISAIMSRRSMLAPAPAAAADAPSGVPQTVSGGNDNSSKYSERKDLMAAGMAGSVFAVGAEVSGCFAVQRLQNLPDLAEYEELADAVEQTLMRGRAIIMAFGWSQAMLLDNEQIARMSVTSWPYFPLVRAVIGHLLNKPEMMVA